MKIIDRKDTGANVQSVTDKEIEVMLKIDHKDCVKLYEVYQTEEQVDANCRRAELTLCMVQVQLVMELMDGRDLFDRVITRKK